MPPRVSLKGTRHVHGLRVLLGPRPLPVSRGRGALQVAPLGRARARDRGRGTVPRGEGGRRPADRQRLLLRLRQGDPVHARGPRAHRGEDARDHRRGPALRVRRDHPRGGAPAFLRGQREVQAALHHPDPRGRQGHLLPQRPVPRPVPRPARGEHRPAAGGQAHARRRRVLARQRALRDAPAHLRHRVRHSRGTRPRTSR